MGWEDLARLSDRELLLLLHQRVENLERTTERRWVATWKVLAWGFGAMVSVLGLFIAGHAARMW